MNRELGQMNQCLYCLTQALRIDPSDVEALWELATIHRDQGNNLKVGQTQAEHVFNQSVFDDLGGQGVSADSQA